MVCFCSSIRPTDTPPSPELSHASSPSDQPLAYNTEAALQPLTRRPQGHARSASQRSVASYQASQSSRGDSCSSDCHHVEKGYPVTELHAPGRHTAEHSGLCSATAILRDNMHHSGIDSRHTFGYNCSNPTLNTTSLRAGTLLPATPRS